MYDILIKPYVKLEHERYIREFLIKRNIDPSAADDMPQSGWVATRDCKPVAMAFLRSMEGRYGQLEGLITDPDVPGTVRHQCIDTLVEVVKVVAQQRGMKTIVSQSVDKGTLERSRKHGFKVVPHTVIVCELGE